MKKSSGISKAVARHPVAPQPARLRSTAAPATYYASYGWAMSNAVFGGHDLTFTLKPPTGTNYFVIDHVSAQISFASLQTMNPVVTFDFYVTGPGSTQCSTEHLFLAQPSYTESGGSLFIISQAVRIAVDATGGVAIGSPNVSLGVREFEIHISGHYE
jgi:hypothetical protein